MNEDAKAGSTAVLQRGRLEGIENRPSAFLAQLRERVGAFQAFHLTGRVRKVVGTIIHAAVADVQVGEIVELYTRLTGARLMAERGREVREFIEHDLGPEGMARSVIVVATSDKSSMERAKAAFVATAVAEYFRDQGQKVLFLMDSVTRFARAQREIGLAAGEPPTRRGFPPSVFANLPKLMERVGMNDKGSITALYTVLVEGDDMNEPVADETRSILDGHIILSRKLASANHYPAIDILASKSRVMDAVVSKEHVAMARKIIAWLAAYADVELLIKVGEYKKGSDPEADMAIAKYKLINAFLQQRTDEFDGFSEMLGKLKVLVK